jgi:N-acetylglucosamine-6-sulfatase
MRFVSGLLYTIFLLAAADLQVSASDLALPTIEGTKPLNVVYILSDDHRYDVMSFLGHPWVENQPWMRWRAKESTSNRLWSRHRCVRPVERQF